MHVTSKLSNDQMTVSHVCHSKTHFHSGADPFVIVSLGKKCLLKTQRQLFSSNS